MEYWFFLIAALIAIGNGYIVYRAIFERHQGWCIFLSMVAAFMVFADQTEHHEKTMLWGFLQGIYGENDDQ